MYIVGDIEQEIAEVGKISILIVEPAWFPPLPQPSSSDGEQ